MTSSLDALRRFWRQLVAFGPHRGAHRVAIRAGVSLMVPLLLVWAFGRLDLSVYVAFGAFPSLYGRFDAVPSRLRMQVQAAVVMLVTMLVASAVSVFSAPVWVAVLVVVAVAGAVTVFSARWGWYPPGALFQVFAAGVCVTVSAGPSAFWHVLVFGGATAAFALAVTYVGAVVRARAWRIAGVWRSRREPWPPWGEVATVVVGSLIAGFVGFALVGTHWYWAMVAAVAALGGAGVQAKVVRGTQRLVGTVAGVVLTGVLLSLGMSPLVTILAAVVCQVGAELFVGRNYGFAMLFITPLALLMVSIGVPSESSQLLFDRAVETLIGVLIGTLIAVGSSLVLRLVTSAREARRRAG